MDKAEVFKLAHAFAVTNKHPDPDAYAQEVADAHTPPEAPAATAADPTI